MEVLIILFIVISIISSVSSAAKKNSGQAKREQRPTPPPASRPQGRPYETYEPYYGEGEYEDGKWFVPEFVGEGKVCEHPDVEMQPVDKPHKAVIPTHEHTREAPKASVKSSLKTIKSTAVDEDEAASIEIAGSDISFSGDNALRAIIYTEILSKPKALR